MAIFRNIMAFIGGIAIVLACVFGFGMINKNFRNFVNDILNTVPAQEYEQTADENKTLQETLQSLTNELTDLTTERDELSTKIEDLEKNAETDAETIEKYKQDLTTLNEEIDNLNDKITTITKQFEYISQNINNATLTYQDSFARVQYSHFDSQGEPVWTEFSAGTEIGNEYSIGSEMTNFLTRYESVNDSLKTTLEEQIGTAAIEIADYYEIQINGNSFLFDMPAEESYFEISADATVEMKYVLLGTEVSREDLASKVEGLTGYLLTANYDYTIDSESCLVNNLTCVISIELA